MLSLPPVIVSAALLGSCQHAFPEFAHNQIPFGSDTRRFARDLVRTVLPAGGD